MKNNNISDLESLVQELVLLDEFKTSDIPDIGLYMDQMTSLIDSKLGGFKRDSEQKILTKTMINNYTKAGLLMPPKNKKYYKEHIILLILIYYLKNILSISDIHTLFSPVLNDICTREDDILPLDDIYSTFLELKKNELDNFYTNFLEKLNLITEKTHNLEDETKNTADMFLTVIMLVAQANAQKRLAEKIIDNYFQSKKDSDK